MSDTQSYLLNKRDLGFICFPVITKFIQENGPITNSSVDSLAELLEKKIREFLSDKIKYKIKLEKICKGAIRETIFSHGPVTLNWSNSLNKRIIGQVIGAINNKPDLIILKKNSELERKIYKQRKLIQFLKKALIERGVNMREFMSNHDKGVENENN